MYQALDPVREKAKVAGSEAALAEATRLATDGSGGKGKVSRDPRLRRCGAGVAACGYVDTDLGELPLVRAGIIASVDGAQTVPRAELTAACLALEANRSPHLTLIVDASYIIRGFMRGPRNLARFSNPDLWARFWAAVQKRGGRDTLTFEKVKSHLTAPEILMGVSPYGSVVLNHAADAFADLASAEVQLPPAIVQEYRTADQRVWAVQKRLLAANGLAMT